MLKYYESYINYFFTVQYQPLKLHSTCGFIQDSEDDWKKVYIYNNDKNP